MKEERHLIGDILVLEEEWIWGIRGEKERICIISNAWDHENSQEILGKFERK